MDINNRLESMPVGWFHYRLLIIVGLGWMFDAMDTGIIAFILPLLIKVWGLNAQQAGYIGSIGLAGMALGAVLSGVVADRIGRKKVFALTLVIYSCATGLCGLSWNLNLFLFFRFLVGFGLGGQLPVAVTLVSEYAPSAARGRMIVLLESFWAFGWLAAGLVSYFFLPRFGWQAAFFIGSLPALYVFLVWRKVPESVRYLVSKGRTNEAYNIVCNIEKSLGIKSSVHVVLPANKVANCNNTKANLKNLWKTQYAKRTLLLWIIWFGIVYSYYGIFTWLPALMVGQGYAIVKTFQYVLIMTAAQLPGYFSAAYLVDRVGRKFTLAVYLSLSAVCAYSFGQGGSGEYILFWGSMMSFFNLGAWGVIYTYTPELYPTSIRASGSGWAAAIGRVGGIIAPIVVGSIITYPNGFKYVFAMFTAVMLLVAALVWFFCEETIQKSLDEFSLQNTD